MIHNRNADNLSATGEETQMKPDDQVEPQSVGASVTPIPAEIKAAPADAAAALPGGPFWVRTGKVTIDPLMIGIKGKLVPIPHFTVRGWTVRIIHATRLEGLDLGNAIKATCANAVTLFGAS